ncbi:hypothetical protein [Pseudonocardia adelaidensis]|uniref:Uncharacterized protein n=1 Tax=Pseudonocardia adelaidensis TaxID=648754 RepID=A0ABP9P083_9PSEU
MPSTRDLRVSLALEQDQAGVLVVRLAVDTPEGRVVEAELTGDELALLLAGDTVVVPGEVGGAEEAHDEPGGPEEAGHAPVVADEPAPAAPALFTASLDDPPADTEPIARSIDVAPGEAVVAYIRGRWRDAVVVRRDIGSLLVTYTRQGSFGQVQQRIATDRVRRRT